MNTRCLIVLAFFALIFNACAALKKEKETSLFTRSLRQEETTDQYTKQYWQMLDSVNTDEILWIKPLGEVSVNDKGFSGAASEIYWLKKQKEQKMVKGLTAQATNSKAVQNFSEKQAASSLKKQTLAKAWLWLCLALLLGVFLFWRYFKRQLHL